MWRNSLLVVLSLSVMSVGFLSSCSDDDDSSGNTGNNPDDSNIGMTANVNGTTFAFETDFSSNIANVMLVSGIALNPNAGTVREIEISLVNPAVGEFTFGKENNLQTATYSFRELSGTPILWEAVSGTVIVTEFNAAVIKGTFNFSAESGEDPLTVEILNGSFDFTY